MDTTNINGMNHYRSGQRDIFQSDPMRSRTGALAGTDSILSLSLVSCYVSSCLNRISLSFSLSSLFRFHFIPHFYLPWLTYGWIQLIWLVGWHIELICKPMVDASISLAYCTFVYVCICWVGGDRDS
jgi:hypothetical protein